MQEQRNVIHITKENFETEVVNSDKKVLIDFYADWCGACRMLRPTLNELSTELDNVKFAYVNVEHNPELSNMFMVMSIPALFVVENGKVVTKSVGALNKPQLKKLLGQ